METTTRLIIGDVGTGIEIDRCAGPAPDGSCPRVAVGGVLPCSGHTLRSAAAPVGAEGYTVSNEATLCPLTVAAALALDHEGGFAEEQS